MKASPISCEETSACRRPVMLSLSPSCTGVFSHTRSATNSRIASATLADAAMPATQEAKEEPVPSARSHIVEEPGDDKDPALDAVSGWDFCIGARIEGQRHGGDEEAGLAVEVMVDEGRVHPGLPGHGPQAGPVVALGGEDALGRLDDLAPGVDVARPATGDGGGAHIEEPRHGVFTSGEFVVQLINDESYGENDR